jgi:2-polyprenyl-6-methoxyphenol hydroxylase-like FAD-dependent oxidoreductase
MSPGGDGRPDVIVAGAGPGGMVCAIALQQAGMKVRVFERDASPDARNQGFVVNLLADSGLKALDAVGLGGAVRESGAHTSGLDILDHAGRLLVEFPSGGAFSVPRARLRDLLRDAVSDGTIVWGARCTGYEQDADSAVAIFDDGRREKASVIVGADGMRSAIREQMHGDPLLYVGVTIVSGAASGSAGEAAMRSLAMRRRQAMTLTRHGSWYATVTSPVEKKVRWGIGFRAKEDELDRFRNKADLKGAMVDRVAGWHAPIPDLVAHTDAEGLTIRKVYDRDPLFPWRSGRVTLLGDAAHPMTPYRGLGANLAMEDGLDLARALAAASHGGVTRALAGYEDAMLTRGEAAQTLSRQLARMLHWEGRLTCFFRNANLRVGQFFTSRFRRTA